MKHYALAATVGLACMGVLLTGCSKLSGQQDVQAQVLELTKRVEALESKFSGTLPVAVSVTTTTESAEKGGASPQSFSDVDSSVPTADMINDLARLCVFKDAGSTFQPNKSITRAEYVTWLFHAYNAMRPAEKQMRMAPAYKVPYSDIKADHPAYKYVQAMGAAGYSVGYDDKTFKPDQVLTREEMIGIKHGVDGGEMYSDVSTGFSDDQAIQKRFHNYVYSDRIFKAEGARGDNIQRAFGPIKTFKPKEPVLRYEAAATLWQTDHRGGVTAAKALGDKTLEGSRCKGA